MIIYLFFIVRLFFYLMNESPLKIGVGYIHIDRAIDAIDSTRGTLLPHIEVVVEGRFIIVLGQPDLVGAQAAVINLGGKPVEVGVNHGLVPRSLDSVAEGDDDVRHLVLAEGTQGGIIFCIKSDGQIQAPSPQDAQAQLGFLDSVLGGGGVAVMVHADGQARQFGIIVICSKKVVCTAIPRLSPAGPDDGVVDAIIFDCVPIYVGTIMLRDVHTQGIGVHLAVLLVGIARFRIRRVH